ncbi:MAG: hypothetical protein JSW41_04010 [Candidatus Aenigmatarchaeota archaeon]|nr:MAG: hypothetical protein JSW41_04010 [Candidatus Aenigmarchaeota archaeon]
MKKHLMIDAFLISMIACIFSYGGFVQLFDSHYMALEYPVEPCCVMRETMEIPESQVIVQSDRELVLKTARLIANLHEYEPNVYDCSEFSRDLRAQLYSIGIKSRVIFTKVNCEAPGWDRELCYMYDGKHEFVHVPHIDMYIEATAGIEIAHSELLSVYGYVEPE